MWKGDQVLADCVDTRPCYGRTDKNKCKLLSLPSTARTTQLYKKDGDCPFCKEKRNDKPDGYFYKRYGYKDV